ncbi:DNA/RNA nuclease SfsA [Alkalitalea saponilacus]|uniref:Sugar fermentation stimulation protein homolog n=1 Tax=Alkalitalea saponilacus TaxID=889453 RepID=A0A1T5HTN0_9BACT|nr:DNA/RNA nuclease SfsA [Alkalitalea saponilacus]ASB49183.1 DNA/RNA nuclease SfsA [Alkalitalea saponilacus]SKC23992.1 sugar fermentation stimulation protein A [Alkalitalea saponilacus]
MIFQQKLVHGTLIKRYKRFLADIKLDSGEIVTAHCTNSGSMKSCLEEGAEVYISPVTDPKRKTRFTWEMIKINGDWVGINTSHPNKIAYDAILKREIPGLDSYTSVRREVKFDESRLDILAENDHEKCAIEVKNVTMKDGDFARFPDARTERGLKHLHTLIRLKKEGFRVAMVYIIQRQDVSIFGPAHEIDPEYSNTLILAEKEGVEIFPVQVKVEPERIVVDRVLPYNLLD